MTRKEKHKQRVSNKKRLKQANLNGMLQQALYYQQAGFQNEAEKIFTRILDIDSNQPDSLHYLGLLYHHRGDNSKALKYIEKSIIISKNNHIYFNNYGLVLTSQNKYKSAVKAYQKAIELKPDYAEAWYNLGVLNDTSGDFKFAEKAYKKAIKFRRDYIKALYNLSRVQELLAKPEDASETIGEILKISPDSADTHNILGMVLTRIGGQDNIKKAEQHLLTAVESRPDLLDAYINLGHLLLESNRLDDAIKCFAKVLENVPDHPEAIINLAAALVNNDELEKANSYLTTFLKDNPNHSRALAELGHIERLKGNFINAEKLYHDALDSNKQEYVAYYGLAYCKKYTKDNGDIISELTKYSDNNNLINFSLGKIYNDIEDYDNAFKYYNKANEYKNNKLAYYAEDNTEIIDSIINTLSKELIDRLMVDGNESQLPVFILGAPRSGTTLLEQIISSHPQIYGGGELRYLSRLAKKYSKSNPEITYPCRIKNLTTDNIKKESDDYLKMLKSLNNKEDTLRITDKMPHNYLYIGYIKILFPKAKIIHCIRNPLDTCLSIYFQAFSLDNQYSFNLKNIGNWYKDYLRLMEYWNGLFCDEILNVEYIDIVNNIDKAAKKIINYCELEWDDKCLEFYDTKRDVRTASQWQVRQPIYRTSLDIWKNYDKYIGPLKEVLN